MSSFNVMENLKNLFINTNYQLIGIADDLKKIYYIEVSYKELARYRYIWWISQIIVSIASSCDLKFDGFNNSERFYAIIINKDVIKELSTKERLFLVGHELEHIMRGDLCDPDTKITMDDEVSADAYAYYNLHGDITFMRLYQLVVLSIKSTYKNVYTASEMFTLRSNLFIGVFVKQMFLKRSFKRHYTTFKRLGCVKVKIKEMSIYLLSFFYFYIKKYINYIL